MVPAALRITLSLGMVHFHVRLGVIRYDTDHTPRSAADNVAAREAQLQAKRDGILQLAVGPQPGTLVIAGSAPSRPRVADVPQVRVAIEAEQVAEDDEMEDDQDDDDDDEEEEEEEDRSDPEY